MHVSACCPGGSRPQTRGLGPSPGGIRSQTEGRITADLRTTTRTKAGTPGPKRVTLLKTIATNAPDDHPIPKIERRPEKPHALEGPRPRPGTAPIRTENEQKGPETPSTQLQEGPGLERDTNKKLKYEDRTRVRSRCALGNSLKTAVPDVSREKVSSTSPKVSSTFPQHLRSRISNFLQIHSVEQIFKIRRFAHQNIGKLPLSTATPLSRDDTSEGKPRAAVIDARTPHQTPLSPIFLREFRKLPQSSKFPKPTGTRNPARPPALRGTTRSRRNRGGRDARRLDRIHRFMKNQISIISALNRRVGKGRRSPNSG